MSESTPPLFLTSYCSLFLSLRLCLGSTIDEGLPSSTSLNVWIPVWLPIMPLYQRHRHHHERRFEGLIDRIGAHQNPRTRFDGNGEAKASWESSPVTGSHSDIASSQTQTLRQIIKFYQKKQIGWSLISQRLSSLPLESISILVQVPVFPTM